jgi:Mycothiol maleylpyruvate isomerase N-terminal domain
MVDGERLLEDERLGWHRFGQAIAAVERGRRTEPTVTPDGWSVDETIHHVGAWLELCADVLGRIAAGTWDAATAEEERSGFVDRWNAEQVRRGRALTSDAVDAFISRARDGAVSAFASLDHPTRDAWSWFEESGPMHYAKHVHDLVAWSSGTDPDPEIGGLLQAESETWLRLAAAFAAVSSERLTEIGDDGWSTHDAVYHLAAWIGLAATAVRDNHYWYPGPIPAPAEVIESRNLRFLEEGRRVDPAAARRSLDDARSTMRDALSALAEPTVEAKRTFEMNTTEHYGEHLQAVQRFLRGGGEAHG